MSKPLVFVAIGAASLVSQISSTAIAVAFPDITSDFNVSIVLAGWVLTASLLATAVSAPIAGKVSDSFGRKRTFTFLVVLFTVASALSAVAPNIYLLIFFRLLQGLGAGGFTASAAGIVVDAFPRSRQRAIAFLTTITTVGSVLGPSVGGWIVSSLGWRFVFWFAVPWGIAALVIAALVLAPDGKSRKFEVDGRGAALLMASITTILIGLTMVGNLGASWTTRLVGAGLLVTGAALLPVLISVEKKIADPLINVTLVNSRPFLAANVYNSIQGAGVGVFQMVPLFAVTVLGMTASQAGMAYTPRPGGMLIASAISAFFIVRWGYRRPLIAGASMVALALALLGLSQQAIVWFGNSVSTMAILLVPVAIAGIGGGVCGPAANNACIELMPDHVSTITGIRQVFRNIGAAVATTVTTIVLHSSGKLAGGFEAVFFGGAILIVASIPLILAMPCSARDTR
ncbi:MAG: MFS transporter [Chloroflexi bacterium]|nr:MFS transporter [Chloroflexota bacterium]